MSTKTSTTDRTALAVTLAPEDVRCGDYVAVLNEVFEMPSWLWGDCEGNQEKIVRVQYCAGEGGLPLKVKAICLPFVFVKSALRQPQTIDVRQCQLVRLDRHFARTAWKEYRRQSRQASGCSL